MNKQISTGAGIAAVVVAAILIGAVVWFTEALQTQTSTQTVPLPVTRLNSVKGQVQNQAQNSAQKIPAADQVVNQNGRLINKAIGYSFQVPSGWKAGADESPSFVVANDSKTQKALDDMAKKQEVGEIPMTVMVKYYNDFSAFKEDNPLYNLNDINKDFSTSAKNFADYIDIAKRSKTIAQNIAEINFAGGKAWIADYEDMMFGGNNAGLLAEHNGHFFRFTFWGSKNDLSLGQKQIISSFRFE
jgi:hypothetical protein